MIRNPRISVVMSVFNGLPYLRKAIDSILCQTFDDFEFIIVDDGSTDGSANVIRAYHDDRIVLVERQHEGFIDGINFAVEMARAELVSRMDADDISLPDRLQTQYDWMRQNPGVGVLGTGFELIDSEGVTTSRGFGCPGAHEEILRNILSFQGGVSMVHPSVTLWRDCIKRAGGYHRRFEVCEDTDLWLRISEFAELHVIPDVLLLLRKHSGNVSVTRSQTQLLNTLCSRLCYWRRQEGLPDPSLGSDEAWEDLRTFVADVMSKRGLNIAYEAWVSLSTRFGARDSIRRCWPVLKAVAVCPELMNAVWFKRRLGHVMGDLMHTRNQFPRVGCSV